MSLLRVDKIANRYNTTGPVLVGPSTISGNLIVTDQITTLGIAVTNNVSVGLALTAKYLTSTRGTSLYRSVLTGVTTAGIVTGATYYGDGTNLTGIVTTIVAGSGIVVTPGDGKGQVTLDVSSVSSATYAGNAGLTTDVKGGTAGAVLYQVGSNDTGFTAVGTAGQVLQSNGTSAPSWTSLTSINVSYADSTGISTNLSGGSAGRIPYQSSVDNTEFVPVGASGYILSAQGTAAPQWISPGSLNVNYANTSGIATNVDGGTADVTTLNVSGISTFTNDVEFIPSGLAANKTMSWDYTTGELDFADDSKIVLGDELSIYHSSTSNETYFAGFGNRPINIGGSILNIENALFSKTSAKFDTDASVELYYNNSKKFETTGFGVTVTDDIYASGIVSATTYYGDGSKLTGVTPQSVTNVFYVNVDGSDSNNGLTPGTAKRTVGAALTVATEGSVIKVAAGNYSENNPLIMPAQVSIDGDSLRDVSLSPQNVDKDFIYVTVGDYIGDVSFTGTLNEGKAVIAFNPDKPAYINQSPYVRNCTNFISDSIGMKIDGNHAIGDLKSMVVDSYTQYNQGGIGVSISNEGYAQLVSIFTICTDQSIVCINGGACDLTNSNSSFGRLGLVADGIGPQNFIGTVTTAVNDESNTLTLNVGVSTLGITTASYDNNVGILTITTDSNHGFNVGQSVEIRDLEFSCSSGPGIVTYPSGAFGYIFTVDAVGAANSFSAYVGVSTLSHNYERAGVASAFVSRPYDGQVVYIDDLYYSISDIEITNGGSGYGDIPPTITISDPSESWGIKATAVASVTNGTVTSIDLISSGRGYTTTPTITFSAPDSGTTATGTATTLPTYYVVSSATPVVGGITTVTFTENIPYAVGVGTSVPFFKQSRILASSHAFEYIGSGNTIATATPQRGGVGIQENEVVNRDGGLVVFTSTDQAGNFRIGDGVIINQLDGSVSGDSYQRSLFANITPYILALGGGD